jgi:hypothetical protein
VELRDLIPSGMLYSSNAHWSVTGPGVTLTEATGDLQGTAPDQVNYNFGAVAGRVTAVISRVQPGQSGTVTFEVRIDPSPAPG